MDVGETASPSPDEAVGSSPRSGLVRYRVWDGERTNSVDGKPMAQLINKV